MDYSAAVYITTFQTFPLARFFYMIGIRGFVGIPINPFVPFCVVGISLALIIGLGVVSPAAAKAAFAPLRSIPLAFSAVHSHSVRKLRL